MPLLSKPLDEGLRFRSNGNLLIYSSLAAATAAFAYHRSQLASASRKSAGDREEGAKSTLFSEIPTETFDKHKRIFPVVDTAKKVGVNDEFFRQLRSIATILFPHWYTKETFLLILHSAFLILRTYLSVVVARIDGRIVRDLVSGRGKRFLTGLAYWFAIAIPATYTNSMIRYLQSKLSIGFRTRLTRYVHDLYLDNEKTFYKALNLDGRIQGADQFITTDVAKFCDTLASLYSNLAKPLLDTVIFNYQLMKSIGLVGTIGLTVNYFITARLLRAVTPSFGKLAAVEAKLEGDFRAAHTRLITNAEEIAFYNGGELEHSIINKAYQSLVKHINSIYKIRISYNMFEDFLIKYAWSAFGLILCAIPVFTPNLVGGYVPASGPVDENDQVGSRTRGFITNKRLMISLADAGGRMMYSYKELAELAGYTTRVYSLLSVLHSLRKSEYDAAEEDKSLPFSLSNIRGKIKLGEDGIRFEDVPIATPAPGKGRQGELLVEKLNVHVKPGEHMLITGPNGVGKTAVARVIATLWPVFEGTLSRPDEKNIFYIPQRPYLSMGSLREQYVYGYEKIIYPHTHEDMKKSGRTDEELMEILEVVRLAYIPSREGGWETVKEWKDVFSGGEKQRICMARLFYHHPKYAVLDECTSAVSADVEGLMYAHAKDMGITLVTISHRPALFKYHQYLLRLTGNHGEWELEEIGTRQQQQSLEKEMQSLETKLQSVEALKSRLGEIDAELSLKHI